MKYTEALHNYINRNGFVRCFYGKCPECGERIFSIGDEVIDNKTIKAKIYKYFYQKRISQHINNMHQKEYKITKSRR